MSELDRWSDRIVSARIIAKALIDMKGGAVKAVFEAATDQRLELTYWHRHPGPLPLSEEIRCEGLVKGTRFRFTITSAPFFNGQIETAAAVLGKIALVQNQQRIAMASRLEAKLKEAAAVAGEVTKSIEARADALIARKTTLTKREHEAFGPHEAVLDMAERGLDETEAALRLLSNDPLDGSDTSKNGS